MATDSLRDRLAERSHYDDCAGGSVIRVEDVPAVVAQWLRDEAGRLWRIPAAGDAAKVLEDLAHRLDSPEG